MIKKALPNVLVIEHMIQSHQYNTCCIDVTCILNKKPLPWTTQLHCLWYISWATLYMRKLTLKTSRIILWVHTIFQPTVYNIKKESLHCRPQIWIGREIRCISYTSYIQKTADLMCRDISHHSENIKVGMRRHFCPKMSKKYEMI